MRDDTAEIGLTEDALKEMTEKASAGEAVGWPAIQRRPLHRRLGSTTPATSVICVSHSPWFSNQYIDTEADDWFAPEFPHEIGSRQPSASSKATIGWSGHRRGV